MWLRSTKQPNLIFSPYKEFHYLITAAQQTKYYVEYNSYLAGLRSRKTSPFATPCSPFFFIFLYIYKMRVTDNEAFVFDGFEHWEENGTYQTKNDNAIMKSIKMNPTAVTA